MAVAQPSPATEPATAKPSRRRFRLQCVREAVEHARRRLAARAKQG
jgi:hypothetical protein